MANNCLITELKSVVDNPALKKMGEILVEIYPSKEFNVTWSNFDSSKDIIRTVSGSATVTTINNGYSIETDSNGCIIGVSNKYLLHTLNSSSGEQPAYVINANDFENINHNIYTLSRAKITGNIEKLYTSIITWSEVLDLTEAYGELDLAKVPHLSAYTLDNNVSITATSSFTTLLTGETKKFKDSIVPIPLSYCQSALLDFTAKGPKWQGNIETDLSVTSAQRVRFDGELLTGRVEKWIEKMIPYKSVGSFTRIFSNSNMSINEDVGININYVFTFNENDVTVTSGDLSTIIGTYTKATSTWVWNI